MVFLKFSHLQVASARETRLAIGEDPYHPRPALYLLVETFEAVGGADTPTMTFRESQAGQTLLDVLLKVLGHLLVTPLAPLLSNRRRDPEGLFPARGAEDRPKVRGEFLALRCAHHTEQIPRIVDLAPLMRCSLEVTRYSRLQSLVLVRDHELHSL